MTATATVITTATLPPRLWSLSPASLPRPLPTLFSSLSYPRPPPRHLLVLPPLAVLLLLRPLLPGSGFPAPASDSTIVLSLGLRAQYRHSLALRLLSSTPTTLTSQSRLFQSLCLLLSTSPLVILPPPSCGFPLLLRLRGGSPSSCLPNFLLSFPCFPRGLPSELPNVQPFNGLLTNPRCSSPAASHRDSDRWIVDRWVKLLLHLASLPPATPPPPLHPPRSMFTSLLLVRLFPGPPSICPPVPSWPAHPGRALLPAPIFSPHPLPFPSSSVPRA